MLLKIPRPSLPSPFIPFSITHIFLLFPNMTKIEERRKKTAALSSHTRVISYSQKVEENFLWRHITQVLWKLTSSNLKTILYDKKYLLNTASIDNLLQYSRGHFCVCVSLMENQIIIESVTI